MRPSACVGGPACGRAGGRHPTRTLVAALVVLAGLVVAGPSSAAPGDLTLASVTTGGLTGDVSAADVSGDGTKVAFVSEAGAFYPGGARPLGKTVGNPDVFVKDLTTGAIQVASSDDGGEIGNRRSQAPRISADGTKVAFVSTSDNLHPDDVDTTADVYVKDLVTGDLDLASTSDTGVKANRGITPFPLSLSADGTRVAFSTDAFNLDAADGDSLPDIFVKDLTTGDITMASTSDAGIKANNRSQLPSLSGDGTKVAFESQATNLDPDDTHTDSDIYVKDLATGNLILASNGTRLGGRALSDQTPSLSGDGRFVAFESDADSLDAPGSVTTGNVFVRDLATGAVQLASSSEAGVPGNGRSFDPTISADGARVSMTSEASNLHPGDIDVRRDVYVRDLVSDEMILASVSSTGAKGDEPSDFPDLASDGAHVVFQSAATNFNPVNTNGQTRVYRKELPPPGEPPPPPPPDGGSDTADQTTILTVPPSEQPPPDEVLLVSVTQTDVNFGSVNRGVSSGSVGVGDIIFTNTLATTDPWSASVAATSLTTATQHVPFAQMSFVPGTTVTPEAGATGTLTPGVGGTFSGADTTPGTTFSSPIAVMTATGTTRGTFTQGSSTAAITVPISAPGGTYTGTLQYTVIG